MELFYGLNSWAEELLSRTVEVKETGMRVFPNGRAEFFTRLIFMPEHQSFFNTSTERLDDKYMFGLELYLHNFPNGDCYEEYISS